ncbi:hypothetical protein AAMO2058_000781300 [Amorphochlora amoebiformis]
MWKPSPLILSVFFLGAFAAYNPNRDYDKLMDDIETNPKAHTYEGEGKLGEMTLYELQDFAETVEDEDARYKVEQFASSMEMMLRMMKQDPATTKMKDLRRMAANRRKKNRDKANAALKDTDSDKAEDPFAALMSGMGLGDDGKFDFESQKDALAPMLKALGLNKGDMAEDQLKELFSPEGLQKSYEQLMKNLGMDLDGGKGLLGGGNPFLDAMLGLGEEDEEEEEFVYEKWLQGLSEKDQKNLQHYLQGETPQSIEELKSIPKSDFQRVMKPLSANRIWRYIHVGRKKKKKRINPLAGLTSELGEVMAAMEKNPRMKEYSEKFVEMISNTEGTDDVHGEILKLTQQMQEDPHVQEVMEKMKNKGPIKQLSGLKDMLSGVKENDFKEMLEQMAQMGLPGFDHKMMERMDDVDVAQLKEEYGMMMQALLKGEDLSSLNLPIIDKIMGRFHDDL